MPTLNPCGEWGAALAEGKDAWVQLGDYLIGGWGKGGVTQNSAIGKLLDKIQPEWVGATLIQFVNVLDGLMGDFDKLQRTVIGCGTTELAIVQAVKILASFVQKWTGLYSPEMNIRLDQVFHSLCPQLTPGQGGVDASWLADMIPDDAWDCWTRLNNLVPKYQERVRDAQRTRPNWQQIISLYRRDFISSTDYVKAMRGQGVIGDGTDLARLEEITKYLPGPSDIIRMMARGIADPESSAKFGYDDNFDGAFAPWYENWAKGQGLDRDMMRRYWRLHWSLPGVGQVVEMLHRLRPDDGGQEFPVSEADAAAVFNDAGIPKFWADRLLAISTKPLQKRDLQQMYFAGVIDRDRVIRAFRDLGSDEEVAIIQADNLKAKWVDWLIARPAMRKWVSQRGHWSEVEQELSARNAPGDVSDPVRAAVKQERKNLTAALCAKGWQHRFAAGEIDYTAMREGIGTLGYDFPDAAALADEAQCALLARPKHVTVAQLCKWASDGLITWPIMTLRLIRLGWSLADAQLTTAECQLAHIAKEHKAAEVQKQKQAAKDKRDKAQQAKTLKEAKAAAAAHSKEVKKRNLCIGRAGRWFGGDSKSEQAFILQLVCDLRYTKGYSETAAYDGLCLVMQLAKDAGDKGWHQRAIDWVQSLKDKGPGPAQPGDNAPCPQAAPTTNGHVVPPPILR